MYIKDGFVYGDNIPDQILVIEAKPLAGGMLLLLFNNGVYKLFDVTMLKGEVYEPLKDEAVFMQPILDHGVVTWKDGNIDCAPEYMYENGYDYAEAI